MKKLNQKRNSFSDRVQNIAYKTLKSAFSAGRQKNVINLTIGQPDFTTPNYLKQAATEAIMNDKNSYTEPAGISTLRVAIANTLLKSGVRRGAEEIIVTSGTTSSIFLSLFTLINQGDEVIVFSPYFVAYKEIIEMLGGKTVIVPTDKNFLPSLPHLKNSITKRTKVIIINSPNNPTGVVYPETILKGITTIAAEKDIYVLSDEIYDSFIYSNAKHISPASFYKNTIVINGFSKSHAVTGWRIGYIAGPKKFIEMAERAQMFTNVCAPSPFQHAALEALNRPVDSAIIREYEKRLDYVHEELKKSFGVTKPNGAFYFFIQTPMSGEHFARLLLKKGVAVVPGHIFGGEYKNYVRVSIAISLNELRRAVPILKSLAK